MAPEPSCQRPRPTRVHLWRSAAVHANATFHPGIALALWSALALLLMPWRRVQSDAAR